MILESVVTTTSPTGQPHLAPMGPVVDPGLTTFLLRPYQSSQTYQNLKRHPYGVIHVTDDAGLMARAAIGQLTELPPTRVAETVPGFVLADCCRWFEFEVVHFNDAEPRTELTTRILHSGVGRPFFGFHRARHAVLEAAILATRASWWPIDELKQELVRLRIPVDKTAGPAEQEAFELVSRYIDQQLSLRVDSAAVEP